MSPRDFNHMLLTNADFLKPFAITLTKDSEAAKDLYQETLYRAIANRDKYHVGTNIRAWLYTIMRNVFINSYRRKAKQRAVIESSPNEYQLEGRPADNHYGAEARIHEKEILTTVHHLPEIFRYPFLLYFDGFRYQEIAGMLKEPLGTIKSRIHFARKMLKAEVDRY